MDEREREREREDGRNDDYCCFGKEMFSLMVNEIFILLLLLLLLFLPQVACEALIAAASKKDKCKTITTQGMDILKKLYQSKEDSIRVRALVGLC